MTPEITASSRRPALLFWFLIFAALFSLQVLPRLSQDSPAGDEVNDIADGFYYWKGDVISDAQHPPLSKALQALPLWTLGLSSQSGLNFSGPPARDAYFLSVLNQGYFDSILKTTRFVSYLFGLALGLVLLFIVRRESDFYVLTVLTLWAFEPALLAFSGFALSDIPFTFFFLIAVWRFQRLLKKPSAFQAVLTGLLTAMAVTTKFTGLLLIPIFLVLEIVEGVRLNARPSWGGKAKSWGWGFGAAFFWIGLVYLPGTLSIPGHPFPWSLFWEGLQTISSVVQHSFYFRGVLGSKTYLDYYPTAFILKSPLGFLVLFIIGCFLVFWKKEKRMVWQLIPISAFFLAFLFYYDIGLRMILPIYPFCILLAGRAGNWMANRSWKSGFVLPLLWAALLIFQALSVGLRFPYQVGYFNELVQPDRRLYWLGDSNLDIGQDTKRLALAAQAYGWHHIKLAYLGSIDPKLYGMDWSYWTEKDLQGPQPGWVYVMNMEFIQIAPAYMKTAIGINQSWIMHYPSTGKVGDTWYYFVVPGKIQNDSSPPILSAPLFFGTHRPHS